MTLSIQPDLRHRYNVISRKIYFHCRDHRNKEESVPEILHQKYDEEMLKEIKADLPQMTTKCLK